MDRGMDARVRTACPAEAVLAADEACALIAARRTVLPKRLEAPGPDDGQLRQILAAAGAAPDHGERQPWRFVIVAQTARERLAGVFAQSLAERDPAATDEQLAQARAKAFRAPLLLLAIARLADTAGDDIPATERLISLGCAIQNMLLVTTAQGFGSALTSGKALQSAALRALFGLQPWEQAACFLSIGTPSRGPRPASRPEPMGYVSVLE